MNCENCGTPLSKEVIRCPNCKEVVSKAGISYRGGQLSLDKAIAKSLTEQRSNNLLAKADSIDKLSSGFEKKGLSMLRPNDLENAINNIEKNNTTSLEDLESFLSLGSSQLSIEGVKLTSLLEGNMDLMDMLKKGLLFLKYKKYREAVTWWALHREKLDPAKDKARLLLLLLEAFTYQKVGDIDELKRIRAKIKNNPTYMKRS